MDLRKKIIDICYNDGLTRRQILNAYNTKYKQDMQEASLNRMINKGNIKFNTLCDVLDAIGYTIEIKKKL